MLRRIIRTGAVLAVLAAVVAVGATLILRSNWLGERILVRVSGQLGLHVRAASFSLGWGGGATLDDVRARMPLSDDVVFSADRIELGLSAVPLLILGRPVKVHSLTLDRPVVLLRQFEDGRWNAQDIWARVQASVGSSPQRVRGTRLPRVVVRNATIRITDYSGMTQMVGPVGFDGRRQGRALWACALRTPPAAEIQGQVVEGSDWTHEVRFRVKDIGPLVGHLFQRDLAPVRLTGRWKGALTRGVLRGALQLDECVVARATLQGSAQIAALSDGVTIHPRDLTVSEVNQVGETIRLTNGAIEITHERITLESLAAQALAIGARIDGRWNWEARRGEFSGSWAAAGPRPSSQYDGTYRLSVASPRQGRKEARANVTVQARAPLGSWHAAAEAQASGAEWRTSQWQINMATFSWTGGRRQVAVAGAAARVEMQWPEIRLTSLSIPAAHQANSQARFDADTRRWSARVAAQRWRGLLPGVTDLDLRLSAEGDDKKARVSELCVMLDENVVAVEGGLSLVTWDLRNVNLSARGPARLLHLGETSLPAGRWHLEASFRLDEPEVVSIELSTHRWPLPWDGHAVTVVVDGRTTLRTNVVKRTAEGEAQLTGKVLWQDENLADVCLAALVRGQTVDVHEFHARVLGGRADGTAVVPLHHWNDSAAQFHWCEIQLQQLETWLPPLARLQGTMLGSLVAEQTHKDAEPGPIRDQGPATLGVGSQILSTLHPLGPMRFVLDANIVDGRFGPAQIDRCQMTGYLDPKRLLVENARFDLLGGRLNTQARLSRHAGTYYGSVVADFKELSLDQLVHALDPNAGEHPGRLAGRVTVLPAFERGILLSGGGRVRLTESDLADNPVVRRLDNTLNLHFGPQEPTGTGEVELQFQGPAVVLSSVQYFNRGVEIRGAGRIENVNLGTDSPVTGYAVASTRVLKGIQLPGVRSLDRLLDVLQTSAGSVKIAGTVDNVRVQVVPLPEVLGPFRRLLWAQLRE